jgi:hypothetical protein
MTSVNKTFGKKLHLSFPGRTVDRDAFGKDVSPGTAIRSSLGLVRSGRTLPIEYLSLQSVCEITERYRQVRIAPDRAYHCNKATICQAFQLHTAVATV